MPSAGSRAGLFVGSGVVINDVGPAAFLTYALTGVLIDLVMRMLGEMAASHPSTGSFADYARTALGGWARFAVGWHASADVYRSYGRGDRAGGRGALIPRYGCPRLPFTR